MSTKDWAKILSKKLKNEIENSLVMKKSEGNISLHINKEFATFEATGGRPEGLNFLYEALNTIPPTSVESERAFSAAGLFVTKLRTCLSDRALNAFCFIRYYLQNND